MKLLILALLALFYADTGYGQITEENKIFSKIQERASFPGGDTAWRNFLQNNINPDAPDSTTPRGTHTVLVVFDIGDDGIISNVRCDNDPGHGMCLEAIRVVKMSPKWVPAKTEGRNVKSMTWQQISFSVE